MKRAGRQALSSLLLLGALATNACQRRPPDAPESLARPSATPVATLNPRGRIGLGVYLAGTPQDGFAAVRQFENLVGHKMEYVLWFQSWGDEEGRFPALWVRLAARNGLIPVITWEPWRRNFANPTADQPRYSLASIAAGRHDAYIRSWAQSARSTGAPLIIRFAHEHSTEPGTRHWYPWQGDPKGYKAAFRRIVALFRAEGASNVQFLWSAMWLDSWAPQYYPGDDVVDLVGTTVLNHGTVPTLPWAKWLSFEQLFDEQYQTAVQWGKPILIVELASAEQGGDKAEWLRQCLASFNSKYPLVRGAILLEEAADREWPDINWSVASSAASLAAFKEAVAAPYFR